MESRRFVSHARLNAGGRADHGSPATGRTPGRLLRRAPSRNETTTCAHARRARPRALRRAQVCGPGPRHHDLFCRGARPRIRDASLRPGRSLAARTPARPPPARAGGAAGGGGGRRSGGGPARVPGSHTCPRRKCGVCVCVSLCVRSFHCLDAWGVYVIVRACVPLSRYSQK
jgi:hypothetical protein